jgi:hypothetical protein
MGAEAAREESAPVHWNRAAHTLPDWLLNDDVSTDDSDKHNHSTMGAD